MIRFKDYLLLKKYYILLIIGFFTGFTFLSIYTEPFIDLKDSGLYSVCGYLISQYLNVALIYPIAYSYLFFILLRDEENKFFSIYRSRNKREYISGKGIYGFVIITFIFTVYLIFLIFVLSFFTKDLTSNLTLNENVMANDLFLNIKYDLNFLLREFVLLNLYFYMLYSALIFVKQIFNSTLVTIVGYYIFIGIQRLIENGYTLEYLISPKPGTNILQNYIVPMSILVTGIFILNLFCVLYVNYKDFEIENKVAKT